MNKMLIAIAAVVLAAGCAFNVEEQVRTFSWERDVRGLESLALSQDAFGLAKIAVRGIDADSLRVSAEVRRLVVRGEDFPQDLEMMVDRDDSSSAATISLVTSGADWATATVDEFAMDVARTMDLDLGRVEKEVWVGGMAGQVDAEIVTAEDLTVETAGGGTLSTRGGSARVSVWADSGFSKLDVSTMGGDITILVYPWFAARLDLKTTRGGVIEVNGIEQDDFEVETSLNGGSASHSIICDAGGGDIFIKTTADTTF